LRQQDQIFHEERQVGTKGCQHEEEKEVEGPPVLLSWAPAAPAAAAAAQGAPDQLAAVV
jgi:hypothetical protein